MIVSITTPTRQMRVSLVRSVKHEVDRVFLVGVRNAS